MVDLICELCGSPYQRTPAEAKRGSRFCSRDCRARSRVSRVFSTCEECGASYEVRRYRAETTRFCSNSCHGTHTLRNYPPGHEHKLGNKWAVGNRSHTGERGRAAWNKGLRGVMPTNSGSFVKGQAAHNRLNTGDRTIRTDKNGRPRNWIKTESGWRPLAQVVWEEHNGTIPDGHVVHHADHDSLNDVIENLQLVTRDEHIRVHSPKPA